MRKSMFTKQLCEIETYFTSGITTKFFFLTAKSLVNFLFQFLNAFLFSSEVKSFLMLSHRSMGIIMNASESTIPLINKENSLP